MSYVNWEKGTYGANAVEVFQWGEGAKCYFGKYCSVADRVKVFLGGDHMVNWTSTYPFNRASTTKGDIHIGNDVWLSHGVTIMSGVTIGDGAIVAANSHVVKNIEPYTINGGNPAKYIRHRFDGTVTDLLLKLKWWDLPDEVIEEIKPILCAPPDVTKLLQLVLKYRR